MKEGSPKPRRAKPNQAQHKRPPSKKKNRQQRLLKKYFTIVGLIVCIFLFGSTVFLLGASALNHGGGTKAGKGRRVKVGNETQPETADAAPGENKINVVVFGVDEDGYRTDVIFVVCFDTVDKSISLVSLPRDTKVTMTDEIIAGLNERDRYYPSGGVCKLNEVHAYAGDGYRNEYSMLQIEELLGIELDHYVKINLNGFRALVDAIGGVDIEVPQDMYYEDPEQGLYINLKEGMQHLDGAKAEGLVRYREGYAQKDLARIQMQQTFLKTLLKKMVSTKTILDNLPSLIYTAFKYVETDVSVGDALKYAKYLKDINMDNVTMETIPGEGGSYFTVDTEGLKELVDRVFFDAEEEPEPEPDAPEEETLPSSKIYSIEVANGGSIDGLAAAKQKLLEDAGYHVPQISTYYGEKAENTRIYVKKTGLGEDLAAYFQNAEVIVDAEMLTGTDIKIILGTEER